MGRDSYRQGWDDAQKNGEPNRRLFIDPDYAEGFDAYMRDHPILSTEELKEEKVRVAAERDILEE